MLFFPVIGLVSITEGRLGCHRFKVNRSVALSIDLSNGKYDCLLHWQKGQAFLSVRDGDVSQLHLNNSRSIIVSGKSLSISIDTDDAVLSSVIFEHGICNGSIYFTDNHYTYSKFTLTSEILNFCVFFDGCEVESNLQISSSNTSKIEVFTKANNHKKANSHIKLISEKVSFARLSSLNISTVKLVKTKKFPAYNCEQHTPTKFSNGSVIEYPSPFTKSEFTCERKPNTDDDSATWSIFTVFVVSVTSIVLIYWILTSFGPRRLVMTRRESQAALSPSEEFL